MSDLLGRQQVEKALRRQGLTVSNMDNTYSQLERFARRRLRKYMSHMSGGSPVLPSEYFGADSGRYMPSPVGPGTDMSATAAYARPGLPLNLIGGGCGGASCPRYVTQTAVRRQQGGTSASNDSFRAVTQRLNQDINSVFQRVRQQFGRNQRHLSQSKLQQTLREDF